MYLQQCSFEKQSLDVSQKQILNRAPEEASLNFVNKQKFQLLLSTITRMERDTLPKES